MSRALLTMSNEELDRLDVVRRTFERRLTQLEASTILSVSLRQMERVCRAYREHGPAGLVSKQRGRPSNRQLAEELKSQVLALIRARYSDFGPTLVCEKLQELHGLRVSRETLRKWMTADGLWLPRKQRRRVHQNRHRRPCVGELVQIDGCEHAWFEDRGPKCTLLVYVDDATSRLMEARFVPSESTFGYFAATRAYLDRFGKPVAFYSDKASIFRATPRKGAQESTGLTQFARALSDLNIDIMCANTCQAKGRVERAHLTLQDRLVKELRLQDIQTPEDGNRFLVEYMESHNGRFAKEPMRTHDAHRSLRDDEDLEQIFSWQETRKVSKNLTLQYKKALYLLESTAETRMLIGRRCDIHEWDDGRVAVSYQGRSLKFRVFDKDPYVDQAEVVPNKRLAAALAFAMERQDARDEQRLASKKLPLREKKWVRERVSAADRAQRPPSSS